ncbi:MAG: extracellular solute-binding protein [Pseudomonadota bacterium]
MALTSLPTAAAAQPHAALAPDSTTAAILEAAARAGRGSTLRLLLPFGSEANMATLLTRFSAATGVNVESRYVAVDDINTYLLLGARSDEGGFDVGLPASFGVTDLVEAGAITPLDEYVARHEPSGYRDGYMPQASGAWAGHFYGYQTDGDVYLGFINEQLLRTDDRHKAFEDLHGRAADRFDSWAALDELMAFYQQPQLGRYGGCLFRTPDYAVWEFWLRIHERGLLPFTVDMRARIAEEPAIAALTALVSASAWQAPTARTAGLFENWTQYKNNNCLINIGWGGSQKSFRQADSKVRAHVRSFEPPAGRATSDASRGLPYFNWGWNYTVSANSRQPELAYLFTLFATCPQMSTLAVRPLDGYFDPFRREHYADARIQESYSPEFLRLHAQAVGHCLPDCHIGGQADYFAALARFIALAVDGKLTPREALRAAAKRWDALTRDRGIRQQSQAWAEVRARYPSHYLSTDEQGAS